MTKILYKKKLTKEELQRISTLLRGRRNEIAQRAGVSHWTVNNTFQDRYQNPEVLKVAKEILQEIENEADPNVTELRKLISSH